MQFVFVLHAARARIHSSLHEEYVIWWAGQLAPKLFEFMFLGMLAPNLKEDPWAGGPLIINSYLMEDEIKI